MDDIWSEWRGVRDFGDFDGFFAKIEKKLNKGRVKGIYKCTWC
jgi:hypothetical protein